MTRKITLAGAALSLATTLAWTALAAPNDYAFEPVSANVNRGEVTISVRLMHKPTGKPVTDAVITQTRIDMAPDGMDGLAFDSAAESRARRLRVQDGPHDGRPMAAEHFS